jgi:hypothetical protein
MFDNLLSNQFNLFKGIGGDQLAGVAAGLVCRVNA